MATVTAPGTFADGAVLLPANWNNNLYGTGNNGVFRGLNGGIDSANLSAFTIRKDIIRKNGVLYPSWTPMTTTSCDWNSEFIGSEDGEKFTTVSGAAHRFYLPYACSWVIYYVSATVEQYIVASDGQEGITDECAAFLTVFVNGSRMSRCDRPLQNWTWASGVSADMDGSYQARLEQHYSFEVMGQNVAAGPQEVRLAVGIQRPISGARTFTKTIDTGPPLYSVSYTIHGRVSAHNRAAGVLACK